MMELFIQYNDVAGILREKGLTVHRSFVGNYMTSLDMAGFSVTLLKLDAELTALLDAPADTPALRIG
jgi:dihydroxyacetone kinase-like protein